MEPGKRVIVVGHTGQDGAILMDLLGSQGCEILGVSRSGVNGASKWQTIPLFSVSSRSAVRGVMEAFKPDEIYYLAASHTSAEGAGEASNLHDQYEAAQSTHVVGLLNFLSSMVACSPATRLFYASSSLVFSGEDGPVQTEETRLAPSGVYGMTKAQGMWLCSEYRRRYNTFASVGILYNHESHLRSPLFLSAKIIQTAIRISRGSQEKLEIGNLSARVDWGYALDYVSAFRRILSLDTPQDFVVATGEAHAVSEFVEIVFSRFGLNPSEHVVENSGMQLRSPLVKIGDATKLFNRTGWRPSLSFNAFVLKLVDDHLLFCHE